MRRLIGKFSGFGIGIMAMLILFVILFSGCTDIERRGYSPIPQNSPASWQTQPYGDMRN